LCRSNKINTIKASASGSSPEEAPMPGIMDRGDRLRSWYRIMIPTA
jgi:hypothetical protein